MKDTIKKLQELHKEFVGGHSGERIALEIEMVVDLLELILRRVDEFENHTHSIR